MSDSGVITDYGSEASEAGKVFYIACDFPDEAAQDGAAAAIAAEIAPLLLRQLFVDKEIRILMFTLIGAVDAQAFCRAWRQHLGQDSLLAAALRQRVQAALAVYGDAEGNVLGEADLPLQAPPP